MIPYLAVNGRFPIVSSLQENSQLRSSFLSALSIGTNLPIKNDESQKISLNKEMQLDKFYRTAAMLIDDSEKLFQRYERIRQGIFGVDGPLNSVREWTGDCQKLHDLLGTQCSRMKQHINHLLSEASSTVGNLSARYIDRSISQDIWTFFSNGGGDAVTEGMARANAQAWTKMAEQALNDIQRLMRHVEENYQERRT